MVHPVFSPPSWPQRSGGPLCWGNLLVGFAVALVMAIPTDGFRSETPIAAGALYPLFGIFLSPILAGAAMAASSVTVVSNANRLRFFRARGFAGPVDPRPAEVTP